MISGKINFNKFFNRPGQIFFLGYLLFFPALLVLVLFVPKGELHIAMNAFHTPLLDEVMKYWTYLGDGLLQVILIAGLLLVSFRYALTVLAAFAMGGISTQILKRFVFSDLPRPMKYFELSGNIDQLHLVDGMDIYSWLSFPSGHTTTAFAVFFALALMSRSAYLQVFLFLLALGVAYSRIYLSQHFLMDIVGGSILGMISGWTAWVWIRKYSAGWLDRSLLNLRN